MVFPKKPVYSKCQCCGQEKHSKEFYDVPSTITFPNGLVPVCKNCLNKYIVEEDYNWEVVDRICQWLAIPFLPDKWLAVQANFGPETLDTYYRMYRSNEFDYVDWYSAYLHYKELEKEGLLEASIPQMNQGELNTLRKKWGNYYTDPEDLYYLENLYQGILSAYSVFGENQMDQVKKFCKMALRIDNKLRDGEDVSKDMKSYDDLQKMADLSPKNIKDATDFSSVGEIFAYLEKDKEWLNTFYDEKDRDIVDSTIHNIKNWTRNLYINESSIPEEVQSKIEMLKTADAMEENLNSIEDDGFDDDFDFDQEDFDARAGV